jgi:hypothetical protein
MNATSRPPRPIGEVIAEASREALAAYYEHVEMLCGAYLWKHRKVGVLCQEQGCGNTAVYFDGLRHVNDPLPEHLLDKARLNALRWSVLHPYIEPEDAIVLFRLAPVSDKQIAYVVEVDTKSDKLKAAIEQRAAERAAHLQSLN